MNLLTVLVSLASGVIGSILSAWITARLALRRFYSEKQWERKCDAYTSIIEAMHHIREHADTHLAHRGKLPIPAEGEQRLDANLENAMADLRRHRDVGGFVVSADAVDVLNRLFSELDQSVEIGKNQSFFEYCDYRVGAVDTALNRIREAAQRDLSKPVILA